MFARLSIYDDIDLGLAAEVAQWFEAMENDPFRELPGYQGSMTLIDRANARLIGVGFYATVDQAQQAEALVAAMFEGAGGQIPEAIRPALEMRPESVGVYEIVHRDD